MKKYTTLILCFAAFLIKAANWTNYPITTLPSTNDTLLFGIVTTNAYGTLTNAQMTYAQLLNNTRTNVTSILSNGVYSVSVSNNTTILNASVTDQNTNPVISLSLSNQTGNTVFASPSGGGSGLPIFRLLIPNDIPTLTLSKISDAGTVAAVSLNGNGSNFLGGDGLWHPATNSPTTLGASVLGSNGAAILMAVGVDGGGKLTTNVTSSSVPNNLLTNTATAAATLTVTNNGSVGGVGFTNGVIIADGSGLTNLGAAGAAMLGSNQTFTATNTFNRPIKAGSVGQLFDQNNILSIDWANYILNDSGGSGHTALDYNNRILQGNWRVTGTFTGNGFGMTNIMSTNIISTVKDVGNSAYSIKLGDYYIICGGTNQPLTLPSTTPSGTSFMAICTNVNGSFYYTNSGSSTPTIEGLTSYAVPATNRFAVFSDGVNYW